MNEKLEKYFFEKASPKFQQLCIVLHEIIINAHPEIKPCIKWQIPAYDYKGLMLGVGAFKHKVTVFFHRGAEMPDPADWFTGQESNKTMRSIQLKSIEEIDEENLALYIQNALQINEQGKPKKKSQISKPLPPIPQGLVDGFEENPFAKNQFKQLNKTQKKEFIHWIASAKREETIERRIHTTIEKLNKQKTCWEK